VNNQLLESPKRRKGREGNNCTARSSRFRKSRKEEEREGDARDKDWPKPLLVYFEDDADRTLSGDEKGDEKKGDPGVGGVGAGGTAKGPSVCEDFKKRENDILQKALEGENVGAT